MNYYDEIQEAVSFIRTRYEGTPVVGVVLGSGLGAFAERFTNAVRIPYSEIPHFPTSGVVGHAGELVLGDMSGVKVAVMSGRVHYYEGYDMQKVVFPVRVLAGLGITNMVVTNAAGSINTAYNPGDFMLIVDHLNLTGANPLRGPNDDRLGPRFPDMSKAYAPEARELVHEAARKVGLSLREGVYAGLAGPTYETPAEIRMLHSIGADAVGMSTVAEVIAAGHAGLRVVGLSVITNLAAGLSRTPLSHDEVKEVGVRVRDEISDLLETSIGLLGK